MAAKLLSQAAHPMTPQRSLSLGLRLSLQVTLAIVLVLALLVGLAYRHSATTFEQQSASSLASATEVMHDSLALYDQSLVDNVQRLSGSFHALLPQGRIHLDHARQMTAGSQQVPMSLVDGLPLFDDSNHLVDRFTAGTGAVATVFVRKGEDFIRATTSVKDDAGQRVIGTPLSRQSPAWEPLQSGLAYTGRAQLFGKDYMTHYQPLFDAQGQVVAIAFIGLDYSEGLAALKQRLRATRLGSDGHFVVLSTRTDGTAQLELHPSFDADDVSALVASADRAALDQLANGQRTTAQLTLRGADGESMRSSLLHAQSFPAWEWTLVGVQPRTALIQSQQALLQMLSLLGAAAALLIALLLFFTLRRQLAQPLNEACAVADAIAAGQLAVTIPQRRADEVGQLLMAMTRMRDDLKERIEHDGRIAAENLRIRTALDSTTSGALIVDPELTIVYANAALRTALERYRSSLEPVLVHLDWEAPLTGQPLSSLEPTGTVPAARLDAVRREGYISEQTDIGQAQFERDMAPIHAADGSLIGYVSQWHDRTEEARIEAEVTRVVEAASRGDLDLRLEVDGREGFHHLLATRLNGLLSTNQQILHELADLLAAVSNGDLTVDMGTHHNGVFARIAQAANQTVTQLRNMVDGIGHSATAIDAAATEMAAGNDDLSRRTELQAASLEETAASMEELTTTVRRNADHAAQANLLAQRAADVALTGGKVVGDAVVTMDQIEDASRRIADIIAVIDGIAFQTNILALNAAVEAARAGEQGRGFAVVASEVRTLAQRSATAAREIKVLIDTSVERVSAGTGLVRQAGSTMEDIVASVQRVTGIMAEISAASQEQTAGIEQVNQTVMQMDDTTQQNAALVEEASAAARAVEAQARSLTQAVGRFRLHG